MVGIPLPKNMGRTIAPGDLTGVNVGGALDIVEMPSGTVNVAEDTYIFNDQGDDETYEATIATLVAAMGGAGLLATAGVLAIEDPGAVAVGSFLFGATGDCTSVTVGAVTYTYDATPVVTDGEWTYGGAASESATNLAAAINGDERNDGGASYAATAESDTVHVYALAAGTAGNVSVSRTGGAQPDTTENLVGGVAVANKGWCVRKHTVTANDVDTAVLVNIPLPFTPTMYIASVMSATGLQRIVTDLFTIGATPDRIILTSDGATHAVAGDVITIQAFE